MALRSLNFFAAVVGVWARPRVVGWYDGVLFPWAMSYDAFDGNNDNTLATHLLRWWRGGAC